MSRAPEICPVCGEEVPPRALACPECGADERSGWREDAAHVDALDLPGADDDFDYEEFVAREFGGKSPRPHGLRWIWWLAAIGLLLAFLAFYLRGALAF